MGRESSTSVSLQFWHKQVHTTLPQDLLDNLNANFWVIINVEWTSKCGLNDQKHTCNIKVLKKMLNFLYKIIKAQPTELCLTSTFGDLFDVSKTVSNPFFE